MKHSLLSLLLACAATSAMAQVFTFPTDELQQGYYNRPYQRYEAEPNYCTLGGNATFLAASDDQRDLQSEASHQQAAQLIQPGDEVSWVIDQPGDGLTLRFSLPDNETGTGIEGYVDVYVGTEKLGFIYMNSWWAWQYCNDNYPDNSPRGGNTIIRMRFDENHIRLSRPVAQGEVLTLRKNDNNTTPYTIDFIELEPVPAMVRYEDLSGDKVQFSGEGDIADFIAQNEGKIIYIPEGTHHTSKRIYLRSKNGTQLIGAGMWYTQIYYDAASDNLSTYDKRGIEASKNNLVVDGIYFNTACRQRYYNQQDSKQVGKAFMGGWGDGSIIRNCWAEHFECGAWIADYSGANSKNLLVEHCRFRNNYADGFNCSKASTNHTIRYCSFRNNGDDDMASWSVGNMCTHVEFAYCTAENNWRASSLGFFGGTGHHAHHLYIVDALECGARVNADFSGLGFSSEEFINIHDITIEHCGCLGGTKGRKGDFWGNRQGALNIGGGGNYDVQNVSVVNAQILDSRGDAIQMKSQSGKRLLNIILKDVAVNGAGEKGIYYVGAQGTAHYCNVTFENCANGDEGAHMPTFVVDNDCPDDTALEDVRPFDEDAPCYDLMGRPIDCQTYNQVVLQNGKKQFRKNIEKY